MDAICLDEKIKSGKTLTVKLGFDPTSPDLHLGHFVVLKGAKKFQDEGHKVVIIVGDFTASIGDPSGRNKLRPPLSKEQIDINAETYMKQVFTVLDKEKTIVMKNSEWLNKISSVEMIKLLSNFTISQMLTREDFKNRFNADIPVHLHELVYPMMQGMDSVAIKADVELGGTDQTFNLMMGRNMQKIHNMEEQAVVTFPLLVGLDGQKKMSKSLGNHIGLLDTPENKFGKVMSLSDDTMWGYFEILLEKTESEINIMKNSNENPKNIKMLLAKEIVTIFHGCEVAEKEFENFNKKFSKKDLTDLVLEEIEINEEKIKLSQFIKQLNFANSVSEANRKIEQNGVKINTKTVIDKNVMIEKGQEFTIQVGKLNIKKVKIK